MGGLVEDLDAHVVDHADHASDPRRQHFIRQVVVDLGVGQVARSLPSMMRVRQARAALFHIHLAVAFPGPGGMAALLAASLRLEISLAAPFAGPLRAPVACLGSFCQLPLSGNSPQVDTQPRCVKRVIIHELNTPYMGLGADWTNWVPNLVSGFQAGQQQGLSSGLRSLDDC